jgi:hypothetical protein
MASWKFAFPNVANFKDGTIMGSRKLTPEELRTAFEVARGWGKIVARRGFGDEGPGLDVDLDQMEELAVAAARGLTAGTLEECTAQQARHLGESCPCPTCGRVCSAGTDERTVHVRGGAFEHHEPKCYCPTCRRDFFPSASRSETGHARLQPGDVGQNHHAGRNDQVV